MAQSHDLQVSELYVGLFGRAPDTDGLAYWSGLLDNGESMTQLADAMFATSPARTYFPTGQTNEQIIASFYLNVLGREADSGGLAYWTDKLNAAGATPGSVISDMTDVITNYRGTDPAGLLSAKWFNNRAQVAQFYGEHGGSVENATNVLEGVDAEDATVTGARTYYMPLAAAGSFDVGGYDSVVFASIAGDITLSNMDAPTGLHFTSNDWPLYTLANLTCLPRATVGITNSLSIDLGPTSIPRLNIPGFEQLSLVKQWSIYGWGSVQVSSDSLQSVKVSGSALMHLNLDRASPVVSVDASANTGGFDLLFDGTAVPLSAVSVQGGSGDDSLMSKDYARSDLLSGGAGNDSLFAGGGGDVMIGGSGSDLFGWIASFGGPLASILDFTKTQGSVLGDKLFLYASGGVTPVFDKLEMGTTGLGTLQACFDAACAADTSKVGHPVTHWFQFAGDTYVITDNSSSSFYSAETDAAVKLVGLIDLSTLTQSGPYLQG